MSRTFDNNSANYLGAASSPVATSASVFSFGVWFKPDQTDNDTLIAIYDSSDSSHFVLLRLDSGTLEVQQAAGGSASGPNTTATFTADGNWHFAAAVINGDSDRKVYLDGSTNGGSSTSTRATTGLDAIRVGLSQDGTEPMDGLLAYGAIWDGALSAGNIDSLAGGADPATIGTLLAYWTMTSNEASVADDSGNGYALTINGTLTFSSDNPTIGAGGAGTVVGGGVVTGLKLQPRFGLVR